VRSAEHLLVSEEHVVMGNVLSVMWNQARYLVTDTAVP
jgi:hypothetical protein